jgi:hypothetical protein
MSSGTVDAPPPRTIRRGPGDPPGGDGRQDGEGHHDGGRNRAGGRQAWITILMAILILIPSMYGFLGKFIEFVHIYRGTDGGEFAVAPIMNYLLASAGFFCMLLWASWNGMFRDVERAKFDFLANEARIDAATQARDR